MQAHASAHPVAAIYVADTPSSAAFLPEWDQWREAQVWAFLCCCQRRMLAATPVLKRVQQVFDVCRILNRAHGCACVARVMPVIDVLAK